MNELCALTQDDLEPLKRWIDNIKEVKDEDLPRFFVMVDTMRREQSDILGAFLTSVRREMLRRMQERGADAIPDKEFEIALDRQYTTYEFDLEKLREACVLLPSEEAAKVIKYIPEHTEVVRERWEHGAPVSITTLAKKYRGTHVAALLTDAMKRTELEPRVVVKPRKTVRNITRTSSTPSIGGAAA
jgi:hypothetical protein